MCAAETLVTGGVLSFRLIDNADDLAALEPAWRKLLEASAISELMLDPRWLMCWWRHYGMGRSLAVGLFFEGNELRGLAPMCRRDFIYRFGLRFRRLEFMGSDEGEKDGVCSEYLNLIASAGRERQVAAAFADALDREAFGPWDECVLEMMDGESIQTVLLLQALNERYPGLTCTKVMDAHYLTLPGNWDSYLESLSAKRRWGFRQALKGLVSWSGERGYALKRAEDSESLHMGMRILADLHTERWRAEGQSGVFASRRFSAFHTEFAAQMLESRQLDLFWLTVADEPIAVQYSFVCNRKVYSYQGGRKMAVPRAVKPGIVMSIFLLRDAMTRGLREYDFLGGDSVYKTDFTSTKRPLIQVRIARRTVREVTLRTLRNTVRGTRKLSADVAQFARRLKWSAREGKDAKH